MGESLREFFERLSLAGKGLEALCEDEGIEDVSTMKEYTVITAPAPPPSHTHSLSLPTHTTTARTYICTLTHTHTNTHTHTHTHKRPRVQVAELKEVGFKGGHAKKIVAALRGGDA